MKEGQRFAFFGRPALALALAFGLAAGGLPAAKADDDTPANKSAAKAGRTKITTTGRFSVVIKVQTQCSFATPAALGAYSASAGASAAADATAAVAVNCNGAMPIAMSIDGDIARPAAAARTATTISAPIAVRRGGNAQTVAIISF